MNDENLFFGEFPVPRQARVFRPLINPLVRFIRSAAIDESATPALPLRPAGTESVVAPSVGEVCP